MVGHLDRTDGPDVLVRFTYDDSYRSHPTATPLWVSMPLTSARHPADLTTAFMWGLLPDNERVLARWSRQFQVSASNPLALLAHVGADLPGPSQIVDPATTHLLDADGVDWLT